MDRTASGEASVASVASLVFSCSTSFSNAFISVCIFLTRAGTARALSLRKWAVSFNIRAVCWTKVSAASPVRASIRLTPEAMLASLTILKRPILPVLAVWVPPQSSLLKSVRETTRTRSPYFSSNKAVAPDLRASSASISAISVGMFWRIRRLTRFSMVSRVAVSIREKWAKSNRNLPGATREPACLTWSPSTCRNTACKIWVAV